jgi:hypothetical protein
MVTNFPRSPAAFTNTPAYHDYEELSTLGGEEDGEEVGWKRPISFSKDWPLQTYSKRKVVGGSFFNVIDILL